MTSVAEVQALLRFLSQDAKVPVPLAMSKVKELKEASLTNPESLSKTPLPKIQSIFSDEKLAKQVLSAAKRTSKKRSSSSTSTTSPSKRVKNAQPKPGGQISPADFEASLTLPSPDTSNLAALEDETNNAVFHTNRAPLVVAFVVQLLKHTMPSQPLSSRLSVAQAVMSMGAKSKALNLGIQSGKSAEDEGWGEGQPKIKVMGREVPIMRRWGYEWQQENEEKEEKGRTIKQEDTAADESTRRNVVNNVSTPSATIESQETIKAEPSPPSSPPNVNTSTPHRAPSQTSKDIEPPLWALNLETLRSTSNTSSLFPSSSSTPTASLPIHDPISARNYLLKSFATAPSSSSTNTNPPPSSPAKTKKGAAVKEKEEKEHNLALLLHALDMLFASWIDVIGAKELDRRAWGWYVRVRPAVESGPAGWGGRGDVRLKDILDLRR